MLPTYIIIKIVLYLPIKYQMKIYKLSKSIYEKSIPIRNNYKSWWKLYKIDKYTFTDIKFVEYIISRGFNDWNNGLYNACRGGNIECVQLMIDNGAYNWSGELYCACANNNIECAQLMFKMGATQCDYCFKSSVLHKSWKLNNIRN